MSNTEDSTDTLSFVSERDLLLVPYKTSAVPVIQWPPFLLASKVELLYLVYISLVRVI